MICTRTGGMGLNHMIRTRAKLYSVCPSFETARRLVCCLRQVVSTLIATSAATKTMSEVGTVTAGSGDSQPPCDVGVSASTRRNATSRRRTSAGVTEMSSAAAAIVDDRPRFSLTGGGDDDDDGSSTVFTPPRRISLRSRRSAAARPPSPPVPSDHPHDAASAADTPLQPPDGASQVPEGDARTTADGTDSGAAAIARRRMTAAERRRLKNDLLSSSSLEISYVKHFAHTILPLIRPL